MTDDSIPKRRIRSFVRREGRMTDAQEHALETAMPKWGLRLEDGMINYQKIFQREAPCVLEIGFGMGASLIAMAKAHPEQNFIGVETHRPGVGALLVELEKNQLTNLRVYCADAVEVLSKAIPNESLDVIQLFFPDPWQKRKHHKRRLIQPEFVDALASKLKPFGTLHLATDWEDYAMHMMKVLTESPTLVNLAGHQQFAERSSHRPLITKFEKRGQESGRAIWELQFAKG